MPEPMPPNSEWQGVYQGPYHIHLRILTEGNKATGSWSAIGGRTGELSGTVSGNVLVFNWNEHGIANADSWTGRGYLVYQAGRNGKPAEISGEAGMGAAGPSNSWWAVKRAALSINAPASSMYEQNTLPDDQRGESRSCLTGCDPNEVDMDTDVEMDTER